MHALLIACGEALYGPQWQSALARDLGVSDRTMRRWIAGDRDIPSGLPLDLLRLCTERATRLDKLSERLRGLKDYLRSASITFDGQPNTRKRP